MKSIIKLIPAMALACAIDSCTDPVTPGATNANPRKSTLVVGQEFLAENKTKPGIIETASGLQYEIVKDTTGAKPKPTDQVTVHYTGKLINGTVFDSSVERGQPATFGLDQVIKGWTEGLQLMSPGSKYRFYIPSELAYGAGGQNGIPPNSVLIFDVELIGINQK